MAGCATSGPAELLGSQPEAQLMMLLEMAVTVCRGGNFGAGTDVYYLAGARSQEFDAWADQLEPDQYAAERARIREQRLGMVGLTLADASKYRDAGRKYWSAQRQRMH